MSQAVHFIYFSISKHVSICSVFFFLHSFIFVENIYLITLTVLATFCCYNYDANDSELVKKIEYRSKRLTQTLPVCYSLLHNQSISSKTVKKVGY